MLWISERDFVDRADLFEKVRADEKAFFGGRIVALPQTPYFDMLLEDGETPLSAYLAYYWWHRHEQRIAQLRAALAAGDVSEGLKISRRIRSRSACTSHTGGIVLPCRARSSRPRSTR